MTLQNGSHHHAVFVDEINVIKPTVCATTFVKMPYMARLKGRREQTWSTGLVFSTVMGERDMTMSRFRLCLRSCFGRRHAAVELCSHVRGGVTSSSN